MKNKTHQTFELVSIFIYVGCFISSNKLLANLLQEIRIVIDRWFQALSYKGYLHA